jgi:two-component system nitrate/nitrite response regulator NarL
MPVMPSTLRPVSNPTYSSPSTKVPAFTASAGIDYAVRALEAGVSGYVLKGSTATNFPTLESVLTGEAFITPISPHCVTRPYESLPIAQSNSAYGKIRSLLREGTNKGNRISSENKRKYGQTLHDAADAKLHVRSRLEVIIAAQKLGDHREADPTVAGRSERMN